MLPTIANTSLFETRAFRMQLHPGMKEEYKRRHDQLWPTLQALLKNVGIREYRIFLDEESHALFAILECPVDFDSSKLAQEPVMRQWWAYMADLMQTHDASDSHEPVALPLSAVFYMP